MNKPQSLMYKGELGLGVLLIHGFSGSTHELRPLGQRLHREGYTVHAPLLKGHGLSPELMGETGWEDWWQSVLDGYTDLQKQGCERIFVVGHSMGGLLALKLAQQEQVTGLVTLCAPIKVRDKRFGLVRLLQYLIPYKHRKTKKAEHIEKELYIYEKVPMRCLVSLHALMKEMEQILPQIKEPILILQSDLDETVDPCSGDLLYERIGSQDKKIVRFKESTHMITLDVEKEQVFEEISQFIQQRIEF